MTTTMLKVTGLKVAYGGIQAVKGVSFEVQEGELVSLIGANGAGKTTTLKAIMGLLARTQGSVVFDGQEIVAMPGHKRVGLGICQAPEGRGVFPGMTVEENLAMGAYARADAAAVKQDLARAFDLFPRLAERRRQMGTTLSGGEQQMLAMARAFVAGS